MENPVSTRTKQESSYLLKLASRLNPEASLLSELYQG